MKISNKRKLRFIRNTLYKIRCLTNNDKVSSFNLLRRLEEYKEYNQNQIDVLRMIDMSIKYIHEMGLTKADFLVIANNIRIYNREDNFRYKYDRKVYITRRDNKSSVNYGSGYSGNVVRYPSKKRSKATWRNFYRLFPYLAEKDGWDGNKSSRYNPNKS